MKSVSKIHTKKPDSAPRYEISGEDARGLLRIADNELFSLGTNLMAREWHGEEKLQRYALAQMKGSNKYCLIPVDQNHEGRTFVIRDTRPKEEPRVPRVAQRTSSRFRALLPALGIAAFLSLDAYVLFTRCSKKIAPRVWRQKFLHFLRLHKFLQRI